MGFHCPFFGRLVLAGAAGLAWRDRKPLHALESKSEPRVFKAVIGFIGPTDEYAVVNIP